jgi:hypothetical protein
MKTTEIFVEQVIIGGLVMLIGYMMFPNAVRDWFGSFGGTLAQFSAGALLVGAAYLIGIVYDRFTDTMFKDLERCRRWIYMFKSRPKLAEALDSMESGEELKGKVLKMVRYPETAYRMTVLKHDSAAQREDYYRRRLRLTRAFATLIPGISIALVLSASTGCTNGPWYKFKVAMIPVGYLLAFLSKDTDFVPESVRIRFVREFIWGDSPPRTDAEHITGDVKKWNRSFLVSVVRDSSCEILFLVFFIVALLHGLQTGRNLAINIVIMLAGTILAMVVAWCWWRIYHTYLSFIEKFSESVEKEKSK